MEPIEPVVPHFQEELEELKARLLVMGGEVEEQVRSAGVALLKRDYDLCQKVVTGDGSINRLHVEIDKRCFRLLALHQPMATDLRVIVSAVKINSDLERIGAFAVNVAEAALGYLAHPSVKPLIDIPRMDELAQGMLRDSLDAYIKHDTLLAKDVIKRDDEVDELKDKVFRELLNLMLKDTSITEPSLDLILISRHLERIGDHATNIAEEVIFIESAQDVRHHAQEGGAD